MTITYTVSGTTATLFSGTNTLPNTFTIMDHITAIASNAFTSSGNTARTRITQLTFQKNNSFIAIPANLFNGCTALTTVIFPSATRLLVLANLLFLTVLL